MKNIEPSLISSHKIYERYLSVPWYILNIYMTNMKQLLNVNMSHLKD